MILAGALFVASTSSCSDKMAHQAFQVVEAPPEIVVPLQKGDGCERWCEAVSATCLNRCTKSPDQGQEICEVQRLECLKGC